MTAKHHHRLARLHPRAGEVGLGTAVKNITLIINWRANKEGLLAVKARHIAPALYAQPTARVALNRRLSAEAEVDHRVIFGCHHSHGRGVTSREANRVKGEQRGRAEVAVGTAQRAGGDQEARVVAKAVVTAVGRKLIRAHRVIAHHSKGVLCD